MSDIDPDLKEMIEVFLQDKCESDGGGWAEVTDSDIMLLGLIIETLVDAKCDRDADGDRTIEHRLINRRFNQRNSFWDLPYETHNPMDMLRMCRDNLSRAMEDLTKAFGVFEYTKMLEEKKREDEES